MCFIVAETDFSRFERQKFQSIISEGNCPSSERLRPSCYVSISWLDQESDVQRGASEAGVARSHSEHTSPVSTATNSNLVAMPASIARQSLFETTSTQSRAQSHWLAK